MKRKRCVRTYIEMHLLCKIIESIVALRTSECVYDMQTYSPTYHSKRACAYIASQVRQYHTNNRKLNSIDIISRKTQCAKKIETDKKKH